MFVQQNHAILVNKPINYLLICWGNFVFFFLTNVCLPMLHRRRFIELKSFFFSHIFFKATLFLGFWSDDDVIYKMNLNLSGIFFDCRTMQLKMRFHRKIAYKICNHTSFLTIKIESNTERDKHLRDSNKIELDSVWKRNKTKEPITKIFALSKSFPRKKAVIFFSFSIDDTA